MRTTKDEILPEYIISNQQHQSSFCLFSIRYFHCNTWNILHHSKIESGMVRDNMIGGDLVPWTRPVTDSELGRAPDLSWFHSVGHRGTRISCLRSASCVSALSWDTAADNLDFCLQCFLPFWRGNRKHKCFSWFSGKQEVSREREKKILDIT